MYYYRKKMTVKLKNRAYKWQPQNIAVRKKQFNLFKLSL